MTTFNYKNAYKLAIQTNRELHISLDAYKVMYENAQKEIEKCNKRIEELQAQLRDERMRNAGVE